MKKYSAFISYSHREDRTLGAQLQYGLQQFARPWYKIRSINIFRDDADLNLSPDLWKSITTALDDSEYFLLLCNPTMTQSYWVGREIEYWITNHDPSKLILILTGGNIEWNHASADFNQEKTNAIHPKLKGFFKNDPFYLDLRWAKTTTDLSLQNPDFKKALAIVSATIRNMAVEDLLGEEVEQMKRTHRIRNAAIATLSVLLACAVFLGFRAYFEQQKAISATLVAESILELQQRNDPLRSYSLANKSYAIHPTLAARTAALEAKLSKGYWNKTDYYPTTFYTVLKKHSKEIRSLSISSDGKMSSICSGNVVYWGKTGNILQDSLIVPINIIYDVCIENNGRWIACSGSDSTIAVINTQNKNIRNINLGNEYTAVYRIALSPNGKELAAACQQGTIFLIETENFTITDTLQKHTLNVKSIHYTDEGKLISGADDKTVVIWAKNSEGRMEPENTFTVAARINEIRMLPDCKHLLFALFNKHISITDVKGNVVFDTLAHTNSVTCVDIFPQGNYVASSSSDLKIHLFQIEYSLQTPRLIYRSTFEGHKNWVNRIHFDKNEFTLYSVSRDATYRKWDNKISKNVIVSEFTHKINHVKWTSGYHVLLSKSDGLFFRNSITRKMDTLVKDKIVTMSDIHEKTKRLVYCDGAQKIYVLNLSTGEEKCIYPSLEMDDSFLPTIRSLAFHPDGNRIFFSDLTGHIHVYSVEGKSQYTHYLDKIVTSISFHDEGSRTYLVGSDTYTNDLWVMDNQYQFIEKVTQVHEEAVITLKTHDMDSEKVLSTSCDGSARVWTKDMKLLLSLEGHGRFVYDIVAAKLQKETFYLTCAWDGYARIWDEQGNMLNRLPLYNYEQGISIRILPDYNRWIAISPYHIREWYMDSFY